MPVSVRSQTFLNRQALCLWCLEWRFLGLCSLLLEISKHSFFLQGLEAPMVLQDTYRWDILTGVVRRKGLMKAEYSLDLRLMKGKEVYQGKEVLRIRQRVTGRGGGGWPLPSVSLLQRVPQTQTCLCYIKVWGCWQCSHRPMKKPFSSQICPTLWCLPMRVDGLLWDCFHRKALDLCATHLRPSEFV